MLTTLQIIDLSLYLLVAALYLPVIVNALRGHGRPPGRALPAGFVRADRVVAGCWRGVLAQWI